MSPSRFREPELRVSTRDRVAPSAIRRIACRSPSSQLAEGLDMFGSDQAATRSRSDMRERSAPARVISQTPESPTRP